MVGLLVAMGVLGDRVGKRRLMVVGAVLFAVVSAAASLTASAPLSGTRPATPHPRSRLVVR